MSDVINNEDDMIYINNGQKLFSKRTIDPESKKVLKGNSEKNNDNNMKKIRKLKSKENPDDNINTIEPISTTFIEEPKKIRIKRGSKLLNIDFVFVLFIIDSNPFSSKDTSLLQKYIIFVYFTHKHFLL